VQAGIALHRARQTGRYEPGDIERFAMLRGHLQRALRIGVQLASMGGMCRFNTEWLERSPAAVVLFDEHRRVLFANGSARALQGRGSGVRLSPAGLTLAWQPDDEKLQSLLRRALASLSAVSGTPVGVMRAARPSGRQPYTIIVSAVTREMTVLSQFRPAACVVVTDPERRPVSDAAHLQAAFGLTRAESQLAALLAAGEKLRLAADKLDITYGTARTRLTQIFQKTGTRGQGELIRLLLTLQS
jgi:DNA-binding CsgD family transcriptional regulator